MSTPRYIWRQLNEKQREELLTWRSATQYLAQTGLEEAKRIWREYPVCDYGKDWDEPEM